MMIRKLGIMRVCVYVWIRICEGWNLMQHFTFLGFCFFVFFAGVDSFF